MNMFGTVCHRKTFDAFVRCTCGLRVSSVKMHQGHHRRQTLVVGLGNYTMPDTRHSVGMTTVNRIANQMGLTWHKDRKCFGDVAVTTIDGDHHLILLKPRLFMNVNGLSIVKCAKKYELQPSDIYLIHDDLDRSFGKYSIKLNGSARGHNGVKSAMNCLKSDAMVRMRIGIGRPTTKNEVINYVLSQFTGEQLLILDGIIDGVVDTLLRHVRQRHSFSPIMPMRNTEPS
ncbi:putative peptidyl-tRNA hydrolase [Saccoglossus kowalevskii]|uniref:Probable peptidyl-tRNA hydrolase-like n=1 Tax=Saccoglossus kowalevskii TaxID=10224 RepID=A0ABM0GLS1_SACKO|nr:PREDICTED: probable peptidyl-tRNA hydrolase-like [Saccoglossus kowalevskii]